MQETAGEVEAVMEEREAENRRCRRIEEGRSTAQVRKGEEFHFLT